MGEKTIKFGSFEVNQKTLNNSKRPITLSLVDIDKIAISDKFKYSDKGSKHFLGYKYDNIIRPLCINLT